jgi:hypothetical protein
VSGKTKCAICAAGIEFQNILCGGKKIKTQKGLAGNVLAIGEEADFEALNFLLALNLMRSTNLHLST